MIQRTSRIATDERGNVVCWDGWSGFTSEEQMLRFKEFRRNGGVDPEEFYRQEAARKAEERAE